MMFYYPLLQDKIHSVEVDINNIKKKYMYYLNNSGEAKNIIYNANQFVKYYIKPCFYLQYTIKLFENISDNR